MSDIWPRSAIEQASRRPEENLRGYRCLMLMPFGGRYERLAEVIKKVIAERSQAVQSSYHFAPPKIERLD